MDEGTVSETLDPAFPETISPGLFVEEHFRLHPILGSSSTTVPVQVQ